jgi:hypothetical protein
MMFSWILSPLGRWLSLAGAVFATLGVAWLKGRAAGTAAWKEKATGGTREGYAEINGDPT